MNITFQEMECTVSGGRDKQSFFKAVKLDQLVLKKQIMENQQQTWRKRKKKFCCSWICLNKDKGWYKKMLNCLGNKYGALSFFVKLWNQINMNRVGKFETSCSSSKRKCVGNQTAAYREWKHRNFWKAVLNQSWQIRKRQLFSQSN